MSYEQLKREKEVLALITALVLSAGGEIRLTKDLLAMIDNYFLEMFDDPDTGSHIYRTVNVKVHRYNTINKKA